MANALSAINTDVTRRRISLKVGVALSGSYTNGTGEPLDLSNIANPKFIQRASLGKVPDLTDIFVIRVPVGFTAEVVAGAGATLATAYALKFAQAGTELTTAAYPAALTGDTIILEIQGHTYTF